MQQLIDMLLSWGKGRQKVPNIRQMQDIWGPTWPVWGLLWWWKPNQIVYVGKTKKCDIIRKLYYC